MNSIKNIGRTIRRLAQAKLTVFRSDLTGERVAESKRKMTYATDGSHQFPIAADQKTKMKWHVWADEWSAIGNHPSACSLMTLSNNKRNVHDGNPIES